MILGLISALFTQCITFAIGLISGIFIQYIILYIKRAKLKIKVEPTYEWLTEDLYFPYLRLWITNSGNTKTEVIKTLIEFKNGSNLVSEPIHYHKSITSIDAKTTQAIKFNDISTFINKKLFHQNKVYRIKVITIDDKVFWSAWKETKESLQLWKK